MRRVTRKPSPAHAGEGGAQRRAGATKPMSLTLIKNPLRHCVTSPPKGETQRRKAHKKAFPRPFGEGDRGKGFSKLMTLGQSADAATMPLANGRLKGRTALRAQGGLRIADELRKSQNFQSFLLQSGGICGIIHLWKR